MDRNIIFNLLRSVFANPLHNSYIRSNISDAPSDEEEKVISDEMKIVLDALSATPVNVVSQGYKLVFFAALALTTLSGLGVILIAFFSDEVLTNNQQETFDTLNSAWKMGFGAIIGLVGGKAT